MTDSKHQVSDRPQVIINAASIATWAVAGAVLLTAALSVVRTLPRSEPVVPLIFTTGMAAAAVCGYLVHARARVLGDARLHWVAGGFWLAGLGLFLQALGLLEAGGPFRTTQNDVAALYVTWHLALAGSIVGGLFLAGTSRTVRSTLGIGAVALMVLVSRGSLPLPAFAGAGGEFTAFYRSAVVVLAAVSLTVTLGWARAIGRRTGWTEAWVLVALAFGTWDLVSNAAASGWFSAFWWSSLSMRVAQFAVPGAGLLAGFVALHRALDRHERSLIELLEVERRRAEEEGSVRTDEHRRRAEATERIQGVLNSDVLAMVFQPITDLNQGEVVGVEALARFQTQPYRPPDLWFAEAAEVGLGTELELMAVRGSVAQFGEIPIGAYLSLNASPEVAASAGFADLVLGSQPGRIVVEITEHARVSDYDVLNTSLRPLRDAGVRIAVDDAGAGFASMRHIVRLSPDFIKLDVTLTRDIDSDPVRHALASSLILFARDIGASIIAEGIETWREIETLRMLGAPYGQGHYMAWPAPLPIAQMVKARAARVS